MKRNFINISFISLALVSFWPSNGKCQGFINLGFESATIVSSGQPSLVQFGSAFPGWTGYIGSSQATKAIYNSYSIGSSAISILDSSSGSVIAGNYTAVLQGGVGGDTSISQTGEVPVGTQSFQFKAWSEGGSFQVSLGGQALALQIIESGPDYNLYEADASAWAGNSATLQFTAFGGPLNYLYLDSIQFSPLAVVPEPETYALFLLGVGGFCAYRRFFKRMA